MKQIMAYLFRQNVEIRRKCFSLVVFNYMYFKRNMYWFLPVMSSSFVPFLSFDVGGATPLHKAVCGGCVEVVQFLLQHGADQNIPDNDGSTALDKV